MNVEGSADVRRFTIDGLTPEDYALEPDTVQKSVEAVAKGEKTEKDSGIIVTSKTQASQFRAVEEEILSWLKSILIGKTIAAHQVKASIEKLASHLELTEDEQQNEFVHRVRDQVVKRIVFDVHEALEECFINHLKHGNRDPRLTAGGSYEFDGKNIRIFSWDSGPGFDENAVPDPTDLANLEIPCGRGLLMMRYFMDRVEFGSEGTTGKHGTSVVMEKQITDLTDVPSLDEDDVDNRFDELVISAVGEARKEIEKAQKEKAEKEAKNQEASGSTKAMTPANNIYSDTEAVLA